MAQVGLHCASGSFDALITFLGLRNDQAPNAAFLIRTPSAMDLANRLTAYVTILKEPASVNRSCSPHEIYIDRESLRCKIESSRVINQKNCDTGIGGSSAFMSARVNFGTLRTV